MSRRGLALACAVLVVLLAAAPAGAEEDSYYYELWTGLMSPFCPGRSLMDCPSEQAAEVREWIQEQEEAGRSRADVEAALYDRFGDAVLQAPRAQGFALAAYLVPAVAVAAGGAIVALFLLRQRRREREAEREPVAVPGGRPGSDPELERRLEAELRDGF